MASLVTVELPSAGIPPFIQALFTIWFPVGMKTCFSFTFSIFFN